jgi:peptidyl-dipeptidase Dcp
MAKIGMPKEIVPRYRSVYFRHIFSGGYSAGYYSYIWSEVLDACTVDWMKANGGLKRENGDRLRRTLLSRGGSANPLQMFKDFTGGGPDIRPLLKRRGLDSSASAQPDKATVESRQEHDARNNATGHPP